MLNGPQRTLLLALGSFLNVGLNLLLGSGLLLSGVLRSGGSQCLLLSFLLSELLRLLGLLAFLLDYIRKSALDS